MDDDPITLNINMYIHLFAIKKDFSRGTDNFLIK